VSADRLTPVALPVDPVTDPDAYRRLLLALLGDDDPAVVGATTTAHLRSLVAGAGDRLRDRPAPGEWSALECIGHLVDGELVVSGRLRLILAEDEPDIVGYDQDRWVARLHGPDDDPDQLIAQFDALRRANLRLWATVPAAARARVGVHRERGPESFELTWRLLMGHDRFHLAQAERALSS
jgi:DinB superfamily